ncbi:MAG: ATP-binding protein [Nitrososphaerales archaeon]|nr:ATP-binding protein [Nitrososphaerales archaeon]
MPKLIGRVADGSTETFARVILLKDLERSIRAEELVLIKNGGEKDPINCIVGVVREGLGKNEFLNHTSYRPDVAYMKYGGEPSGAREVYSFTIRPIGVITENGVEPNRTIIQPRSPVYLLEESDKPLEWIAKGDDILWMDAYLEGHETWYVPVKKTFIPYHVAVYGSTGSGKSFFTRYVLIPLYIRAGYRVLVLDWSGTDYAPYFQDSNQVEKINIMEISLDEESVLSYFEDKTFGFANNDNVRDGFDSFIEGWLDKVKRTREEFKGDESAEALYGQIKKHVQMSLSTIKRDDWRSSAERAMRRVFRRLKPSDLRPVMGTVSVEELLKKFEERVVIIIDMSGALAEAKLGFFLSLSKYLYNLMEAGNDLNIALIIDEAPQYAPWEPRGIQGETSDMIKDLAALGRKRSLNLTLIAQGIRGEIGINAAVRRNLNTQFFGRIHPLDAGGEGGASEWLSPYGITPDQMLQLKPGMFYFTGVMNPSPIPLLITYKL